MTDSTNTINTMQPPTEEQLAEMLATLNAMDPTKTPSITESLNNPQGQDPTDPTDPTDHIVDSPPAEAIQDTPITYVAPEKIVPKALRPLKPTKSAQEYMLEVEAARTPTINQRWKDAHATSSFDPPANKRVMVRRRDMGFFGVFSHYDTRGNAFFLMDGVSVLQPRRGDSWCEIPEHLDWSIK